MEDYTPVPMSKQLAIRRGHFGIVSSFVRIAGVDLGLDCWADPDSRQVFYGEIVTGDEKQLSDLLAGGDPAIKTAIHNGELHCADSKD
ncbi:MAG: hypothetical protein WA005_06560 [Candidatus Binataceae bacterium]